MGSVTVSIDAELGWGFHHRDAPPRDEPPCDASPRDRLDAARPGWRRLVSLLDEYDVPATWAIVGHLFLADCDRRHADHPAPDGWFDHERGPDRMNPMLRYGYDLVDAVRAADAGHEIGCHSFSHVDFGAQATTQRLARAELAASADAARDRNASPSSFTFPHNNVAHRATLAEAGVCCYRGPRPSTRVDALGSLGRLARVARATVTGGHPPLVQPTMDEFGLVNVPASLHLFELDAIGRDLVAHLPDDPVVRQARRGVDAAAEHSGVFHVWLNPNDLVSERRVQQLRATLDYLDRARADADLHVETMHEAASRVHDTRHADRGANAPDRAVPRSSHTTQ